MRGTTIATWWRMLALAVLTGLAAGCASLSAPPMTAQQECERSNHTWRQVLNFCEPC